MPSSQCALPEQGHAAGTCPPHTSFTPLSLGDQDVYELEFTSQNAEPLVLPFDLLWMGTRTIPEGSAVFVSKRGQINVSPLDNAITGCDEFPDIDDSSGTVVTCFRKFNGSFGGPRISMVLSEIDPSVGGKVLAKETDESVIVSFQEVAAEDGLQHVINVQTELFSDGKVTICFGAGSIGTFTRVITGVEDPCLDLSFPADETNFGYSSEGVTDSWPAGFCYCYDPCSLELEQETPVPTKAPTTQPTESPMFLPSHHPVTDGVLQDTGSTSPTTWYPTFVPAAAPATKQSKSIKNKKREKQSKRGKKGKKSKSS